MPTWMKNRLEPTSNTNEEVIRDNGSRRYGNRTQDFQTCIHSDTNLQPSITNSNTFQMTDLKNSSNIISCNLKDLSDNSAGESNKIAHPVCKYSIHYLVFLVTLMTSLS